MRRRADALDGGDVAVADNATRVTQARNRLLVNVNRVSAALRDAATVPVKPVSRAAPTN